MSQINMTDSERAELRKALVKAGIRTRGMTDDEILDEAEKLEAKKAPTQPAPAPTQPTQPTQPAPAQPQKDKAPMTDNADQLADALRGLLQQPQQPLDETRVIELVKQHASAPLVHTVKVNDVKRDTVTEIENAHPILATVIGWISTNTHVYLTGGAGSGKTTIAEQTAKALNRDFYHNGALLVKFELIGFIDANGKYHTTSFREAYEKGGVYLFDEIDGSVDIAVLAMNQALANGEYAFPDQIVKKHPNFVAIAAANTVGTGANMQYVGRNALDGASLDRFTQVTVEYDHAIENAMAHKALAENGGKNTRIADIWVSLVRDIRDQASKARWSHLITPRASMFGCRGIAAGLAPSAVVDQTITKHFSDDQKAKVKQTVKTAVELIETAIKNGGV